VKSLTESLLRKDVVPVVVPELPFFGSLRKVIGEAAYPLPLGGVGDIRVILLLLSLWTVIFASHCVSLLHGWKALAMPKPVPESSLRCN
jgi:hypothetical protein